MRYEQVRRMSRALLGHRYRLELLAEAGDRGVCLCDVAVRREANASVFYPPLRELKAIGLVSRMPNPAQDVACTTRPPSTGHGPSCAGSSSRA